MNDLTLCRPLGPFDLDDWEQIQAAFQGADGRELVQNWRAELESRFTPATAYFGWRENTFFVYAVAEDRDIFSAVDGPNQATWELGDCLELFFGVPNSERYYEMHVTPDNHRLQLRFADHGTVWSGQKWTEWHVNEPLFDSRVLVDPVRGRWQALFIVDMLQLEPEFDPQLEPIWSYSVSRYDWTRGEKKPVLSSTSKHAEPGYHRQHEWGRLKFVNEG